MIVFLFLLVLASDAFGQILPKEEAMTKGAVTPVQFSDSKIIAPPKTGGDFGKDFDIPVDATGIISVGFDCDQACLNDPTKDFFLVLDWQPDGVNWDTHTAIRLVGPTLEKNGTPATEPFGFSFNLEEAKWLVGKKVRVRIVSKTAINVGATIGIEGKK